MQHNCNPEPRIASRRFLGVALLAWAAVVGAFPVSLAAKEEAEAKKVIDVFHVRDAPLADVLSRAKKEEKLIFLEFFLKG